MLADLAIGRMRAAGKLADLSQALAGRFTDHHALLCRLHLDRIKVTAGGFRTWWRRMIGGSDAEADAVLDTETQPALPATSYTP